MRIIICKSNGPFRLYNTKLFIGFNIREEHGKLFSRYWICLNNKWPFVGRFYSFETSVIPSKIYFKY